MKNLLDLQELQQFDRMEILARQIVEGFITGLHRSPFHGFSVEFAEHRLYNTGESIRHVDWKLYGRTEKMFVKRFEEETNLRSYLIIDNSSSMLYPQNDAKLPTKLAFSVFCAAALVHLLRKQRDAVGLSLFSDHIEFQTEARVSPVHAQLLYATLSKLLESQNIYRTESKSGTAAAECLHQLAEQVHKRSLVVIFSDMLETNDPTELISALKHLRHRMHEVVLFHVTDRAHEIDFKFSNRPHKFIDMETGHELKINPNEIREEYTSSIRKYFDEIKLRCAQFQVDLVEVDIKDDFSQVLLAYLIKREKLM